MNQKAQDLMMNAPSEVSPEQLRDLRSKNHQADSGKLMSLYENVVPMFRQNPSGYLLRFPYSDAFIPMDDSQTDHLKAYGIVYKIPIPVTKILVSPGGSQREAPQQLNFRREWLVGGENITADL